MNDVHRKLVQLPDKLQRMRRRCDSSQVRRKMHQRNDVLGRLSQSKNTSALSALGFQKETARYDTVQLVEYVPS